MQFTFNHKPLSLKLLLPKTSLLKIRPRGLSTRHELKHNQWAVDPICPSGEKSNSNVPAKPNFNPNQDFKKAS